MNRKKLKCEETPWGLIVQYRVEVFVIVPTDIRNGAVQHDVHGPSEVDLVDRMRSEGLSVAACSK